MPPTLRLILAVLLLLVGVAFAVLAVLGARSRLRRNRWVGVRTPRTLSSEPAFVTGNKAAAVPTGAAGAVAVLGGAVLLGSTSGVLSWVVLVIGAVGVFVLAGIGGLVGDRAAGPVQAPPSFSAGCAGTCAGCDLVAGCRPAAADSSPPGLSST